MVRPSTSSVAFWLLHLTFLVDIVVAENNENPSPLDNITLWAYTRSNSEKGIFLPPAKNEDWPDWSKSTHILIHGFTGNRTAESMITIRNAFLKVNDCVVVIVDWGPMAAGEYYENSVFNTFIVADYIAQFLLFLKNTFNKPLEEMHLVGFSLGAHVAGLVSNYLPKNESLIGRIDGLDAARPMFEGVPPEHRLSPDDASFVMVVHTSIHSLALDIPLGHVDFYPNGGLDQPGCKQESLPIKCNHFRAFQYYSEALERPWAFRGRRCEYWEDFLKRSCPERKWEQMGSATNVSARGKYYLRTNSRPPFGLELSEEERTSTTPVPTSPTLSSFEGHSVVGGGSGGGVHHPLGILFLLVTVYMIA